MPKLIDGFAINLACVPQTFKITMREPYQKFFICKIIWTYRLYHSVFMSVKLNGLFSNHEYLKEICTICTSGVNKDGKR